MGLQVLAHPLETPFAQVDVLAYNPKTQTLALIEIKSWDQVRDPSLLVSFQQRRRLLRAHQYVMAQYPQHHIRSLLATVSVSDKKICWIPDFLSKH